MIWLVKVSWETGTGFPYQGIEEWTPPASLAHIGVIKSDDR